jgi:predicted dehydrogenase
MEKLDICFVGLGSIAFKHLNNIFKIEDNTKISVDAYRTTNQTFYDFSKFSINSIYNINELKNYYDLIFITNPTIFHLSTFRTIRPLSDKIFIEKPLFSDLLNDESELDFLYSPLDYVAAPIRFSNIYKEIKKITDLHSPISVRIICSSYMPNWQKGRDYRNSFRTNITLGGGVDLDLIHEIDYMIGLFGYPINIIKKMNKHSSLEMNASDISIYIFEYSNFFVEVHLDYFGVFERREIELFYNDNFIKGDFINGTIYTHSNKSTIKIEKNDNYFDEIFYFLKLTKSSPNLNNLYNAYKTLKISKGLL